MIALVDYGSGNIGAFATIFRRLGVHVVAARTPEDILRADKIILPGVGAFDWAMARLNESGLREALDEMVVERGVDVLGVCVGMQMMAQSSEEGSTQGLGWINAEVLRFRHDSLAPGTRLPHMGWNDVRPVAGDDLFSEIESPRYYFLHSYFISPSENEIILATADYGVQFAAAVRARNVYGTQFHPEKSHHWGVSLLKNFAQLK